MFLQHILDNVYYLPGPSNVGLVVGEAQQAFLIDTGVGRRSGRQILQVLEEHGLHLVAILNTHSHGDHVGGNAYLVEHTGARVYAPLYDSIVLQQPLWGTLCLFGGAEPIAELRTPRFAAEPCDVDVVVTAGPLQVAGVEVEVVPLPGHTGTHTGYIVGEVFFTGDSLAGDAELANSAISYAYSVSKSLESLQQLRRYSCARYVPGHGTPENDITSLVERNIARLTDVMSFVKGYLTSSRRENASDDGVEAGEILKAVCERYGIEIRTVRQYFLLYPTLHSFLSHLSNNGEISYCVVDNRLLWRAA